MAPGPVTNSIDLVGLDYGSTTSSMLVFAADIAANCTTGRMAFQNTRPVYRSEPVFTPFHEDSLDLQTIHNQLQIWLDRAGLTAKEIFSGGAIITGLAAQRTNASGLTTLLRKILGDAIIATADDPRLEAWLAYMGSCASLSRENPRLPFLNLDIGGGTTNPALGCNGNVDSTGSYFIGARHFEFEPGGYHLTACSRYGTALLQHLGCAKKPGQELHRNEVAAVVAYYTDALAAIARGDKNFFTSPIGSLMEQSPFRNTPNTTPVLTFSGGVADLVYAMALDNTTVSTTRYGDLGADLARAILQHPLLSRDIRRFTPASRGRATVQGLTLNNTDLSGSTIFVSQSAALPLSDLPVIASMPAESTETALTHAMRNASRSRRGFCMKLTWTEPQPRAATVKQVGTTLANAMNAAKLTPGSTLVILTTANVGKALGNYATAWDTSGHPLMIIDEIPERDTHFVNLGPMRNGIVPVSFYGLL